MKGKSPHLRCVTAVRACMTWEAISLKHCDCVKVRHGASAACSTEDAAQRHHGAARCCHDDGRSPSKSVGRWMDDKNWMLGFQYGDASIFSQCPIKVLQPKKGPWAQEAFFLFYLIGCVLKCLSVAFSRTIPIRKINHAISRSMMGRDTVVHVLEAQSRRGQNVSLFSLARTGYHCGLWGPGESWWWRSCFSLCSSDMARRVKTVRIEREIKTNMTCKKFLKTRPSEQQPFHVFTFKMFPIQRVQPLHLTLLCSKQTGAACSFPLSGAMLTPNCRFTQVGLINPIGVDVVPAAAPRLLIDLLLLLHSPWVEAPVFAAPLLIRLAARERNVHSGAARCTSSHFVTHRVAY